MATTAPIVQADAVPSNAEPLLEQGDRLTRDEFERRYERMSRVRKAELVEGTVYMPSPVRFMKHSVPHRCLATWAGTYVAETPGVECGDNSSVRLDLDNEPQPDLVLIKLPVNAGQTRISSDDYLEGATELVVEIVASSKAYDLHQKRGAYRRNGVCEYLAWITGENCLVWWELREGEYQELSADAQGILRSKIFPGLWLDTPALLKGDMKTVLTTLRRGLESPQHIAFLSG
jgi:Uma2 family endonuclease